MNVVRFATGARNAWHSHARGQTLHVTDGNPSSRYLGLQRMCCAAYVTRFLGFRSNRGST